MRLHRSALLISLLAIFAASPALAAGEHGIALGARSLSFSLPSGGGALVGATYFFADTSAIHVDFGYSLTIPDEGDKTAGFTVVPAFVKYLTVNRMATFWKIALNLTKAEGVEFGDALTADLGGFFGAEFFFLPQLSVSGEIGAAINFRDKFKKITSQAGTGALFANFYF